MKRYNFYNTPENIYINKIIKLINEWQSYMPKEKQFMYEHILNIIGSINDNTFDENLKIFY